MLELGIRLHVTVTRSAYQVYTCVGACRLLKKPRIDHTDKTLNTPIDTNALLVQLRTMAQDAGIPAAEVDKSAESSVFADALKASMEEVNTRGSEAQSLRESYERGDPNVELSDVMVAMQKARISFEAMTQVRNRMVSAYKDIMNMPI